MIEEFKAAVRQAVEQFVPNEIHVLDNVPEEAWEEYCRLIHLYKTGASVSYGWYKLVSSTMIDIGVEERTADILACVRSEIKFKPRE